MWFKDREVRMHIVKTPKAAKNEQVVATRYPTVEQLSRSAVLVGALYVTKRVVDVAGEVALLAIKAKIQ